MKISYQIILIISVIALTVNLSSAFSIFSFINSYSEKVYSDAELDKGRNFLASLDLFLYERYVDVQAYAGREQLKRLFENGSKDNRDEVIRQFKEIQYISGVWENLGIIDLSGDVLVSTDVRDTGLNVFSGIESGVERVLFERVLSGEISYSDVFLSDRSNQPTMIFMAPIWDTFYGSRVIGVIMAHLNWSIVLEKLENIKNGGAHLVQKDGLEIGSSYFDRRDFILKNHFDMPDLSESHEADLRLPEDFDEHMKGAVFRFFNREEGYLDYKGNDWVLILETPSSVILGPGQRLAVIVIVINIAIFLLAGSSMVVFINRRIIRPIKKISAVVSVATEQVTPEEVVGIESNDEIGSLALGFNFMTKRLKRYYAGLQEVVSEKTKDLNDKVLVIEANNKKLQDIHLATLNLIEDIQDERNRAEKERSRIDAILQSIGDGVFVVDDLRRIRIFNSIAEQISGLGAHEVINKHYKDVLKFILEKDGSVNYKFIEDVFQTGKIKKMANHTALVRKDGTKVPVADSAAPVKDRDGKVIGCIVVFRDITHEREVDRAKSEFVSLAAHQMRTPLSTVNWYAEILLSGDLGVFKPEQEGYLREIQHSNQRMIDLVNVLLDVSKIELGNFIISVKRGDPRVIADSVVSVLSPMSVKKGVKIIKDFNPSVPLMDLDAKLLDIVLHNLLTNAIKYSPAGKKVTLSIGLSSDGGALIKVADSGYGIPKDEQSKIFSKLFRASNIRDKETDGTGLGLYIVQSIVTRAGGKIWFESQENIGTTFYISFPITGMRETIIVKD